MPGVQGFHFARLEQPVARVLPDRLQQPVANHPVPLLGDHQRLVHKMGQEIEHVLDVNAVAATDLLSCLRDPASSKHRQPPQQHPFRLGQQFMAPVNRRLERLLPAQPGPSAIGQEAKAIVQPSGQLPDAQSRHASGGQFERQRDAIQPLTDLHHGGRVLRRHGEARLRLLGPRGKELDGLVGEQFIE